MDTTEAQRKLLRPKTKSNDSCLYHKYDRFVSQHHPFFIVCLVVFPQSRDAVFFFDIFSLELLYLPVFTSAERSKKQQKTAISTLGPKKMK